MNFWKELWLGDSVLVQKRYQVYEESLNLDLKKVGSGHGSEVLEEDEALETNPFTVLSYTLPG